MGANRRSSREGRETKPTGEVCGMNLCIVEGSRLPHQQNGIPDRDGNAEMTAAAQSRILGQTARIAALEGGSATMRVLRAEGRSVTSEEHQGPRKSICETSVSVPNCLLFAAVIRKVHPE